MKIEGEKNMLEKLFKLKENKTNISTELIAGLTTFMAVSYIISFSNIFF